MALLSGVASASSGLVRAFASELNNFQQYLITGEFDMLLTRPWPTLAILLARNCDLARLRGVLQGYGVMALGLWGLLERGAPLWLAWYVPLLPLAGALIAGALHLAVAAAGFWLTIIEDLSVLAIHASLTAASYPMETYPRWLRRLLTGILPVAAMGYLSIAYALGKSGAAWHLALPFLTGAAAALAAYRLWRWGERHYQSTGN